MRLVLVGAGAFGRVVSSWVELSPLFREQHEIDEVVFVDDSGQTEVSRIAVISTVGDYVPSAEDRVICTIGSPLARRRVVERLRSKGAQFITFRDDRSLAANNVVFGEGTVLCPGVVIQPDVVIGSHVHIGSNCTVGHDTRTGDFVSLSPLVNLMSTIEVGDCVFFGGSSIILPKTNIGSEAVIGAGAVVVKDITLGDKVIGMPAKSMIQR